MKKSRQPPDANQIKTLDDMVAYVKSQASDYVALIERNGLSFKEYLIMTFAISSAYANEAMTAAGQQAPPGFAVNQANVAFVRANKAKLQAIFAEYQKMGQQR